MDILGLDLTPLCHVSLPYIMGFDIKINHPKSKWHVRMHHVVIVAIIVITVMLTLYFLIISQTTSFLFHPTTMITLHNSLLSHALWLPQAWHFKVFFFKKKKKKHTACWNKVCIHINIHDVFSVDVLDYSMINIIFNNWCSILSL
jgi:hypothetical protein